MSAGSTLVKLSLAATPDFPLDLAGVVPDAVAGLKADAVRRLPVVHGNKRKHLGDFFEVAIEAGTDAAPVLAVTVRDAIVHRLGAGMRSGRLEVRGDVGLLAGHRMAGGLLRVSGSVGDYAGSEMLGGTLDIGRDAADFLGAAHPTAMRGMNGGLIRVKGRAGNRLGHRMRRGIIVTQGGMGDYCASAMIAGTIVSFGHCGRDLGAGMRRGTVLAFDSEIATPPGFEDCGTFDFNIVELLARYLEPFDSALARRLRRSADGPLRRLAGDVAGSGMGEILTRPVEVKGKATA